MQIAPRLPVVFDAATQTKQMRDLSRIHIDLMNHRETCLFGGVIMRGDNTIVYDGSIPTACTDGKNKWYGAEFTFDLPTVQQQRGLVLHENLHDALLHAFRDADLRKKDAGLYNAACDYVINDIILSMPRDFIDLPEGRLHDDKFKGWDVRKVFTYLYEECEPEEPEDGDGDDGDDGDEGGSGGTPKPGKPGKVRDKKTGETFDTDTGDEHDFDRADSMTPEEIKQEAKEVADALQEGVQIAGLKGGNVPRAIHDSLTAKVDWKEQLRDFVCEVCKGRDDYTWRTYNRRRLADDLYVPSTESETVGELVIAIDTSGSISNSDIARVASELHKLCEEVQPSMVRVLWWDTEVRGQQAFFSEQYGDIRNLLKPQGGGGTRASCVSEYIVKHKLQPEAVIMLTDGYLEHKVKWDVTVPTLWVLTPRGDTSFVPPKGIVINMDKE